MASRSRFHEFADDLERLLKGEMSKEAIRSKYWVGDREADTEQLMAYVEHFLTDADIREGDEWYRRMQEHEMRKMIACLRTGNLMKAKQITFLEYSDE